MYGARPPAVTSCPAQRSPTQDPAFTRVEDHGVSTAHSFKSHARLFPRSRFCLSFCLPFCPLFSFVFFISFLFSLSAGGNGHPTCLVKSRGQRRRRAGTLQSTSRARPDLGINRNASAVRSQLHPKPKRALMNVGFPVFVVFRTWGGLHLSHYHQLVIFWAVRRRRSCIVMLCLRGFAIGSSSPGARRVEASRPRPPPIAVANGY
jgi:hypothetical protein